MVKRIQKPTTALYPLPAVLVSCGTGSQAVSYTHLTLPTN